MSLLRDCVREVGVGGGERFCKGGGGRGVRNRGREKKSFGFVIMHMAVLQKQNKTFAKLVRF